MIISINIYVKPESELNAISVCFMFLYKMLKIFLHISTKNKNIIPFHMHMDCIEDRNEINPNNHLHGCGFLFQI